MKRTWTMAAVALAATGALAMPAVASAAPSDPHGRLEAVCARVPGLTTRVDAAIARLEGDASTRGSLAWLQVQIDRAQRNDRPQLVTVLQNRLEVRTARLDLLKAQAGLLDTVGRLCADHGA